LRIRSKMWVVEDNEVVFGDGRRRLLEILERTGSLNQAAKELKMSYRAAWGKVKATEKRLGIKIVETHAGGRAGGGSTLTPEGKELLRKYKDFKQRANEAADALFKEIFEEQ